MCGCPELVLAAGTGRERLPHCAVEPRRTIARAARAVHPHAVDRRVHHCLVSLHPHTQEALARLNWIRGRRRRRSGRERLRRRAVRAVAARQLRQLVRERRGRANVVRARAHVDRHAAEAVEVPGRVRVEAHGARRRWSAAQRVRRRQPARLRRAALARARRHRRHSLAGAQRGPARARVVAVAGGAGGWADADVAPWFVELAERLEALWTARVAQEASRRTGARCNEPVFVVKVEGDNPCCLPVTSGPRLAERARGRERRRKSRWRRWRWIWRRWQ